MTSDKCWFGICACWIVFMETHLVLQHLNCFYNVMLNLNLQFYQINVLFGFNSIVYCLQL